MSPSAGNVAANTDAVAETGRHRQARRDIERGQNLPPALAEAMTEARFVRMWRCRALGRPQLDFTGSTNAVMHKTVGHRFIVGTILP